ncbi:hypothetical protein [Pleomorphomonas sp. JP5]|uniref:hypothetical protein n=1 Tax=Pleomorphomonas sp. JP5 TaxID=2942998 RepID=UPI002043F295|nr:hypothetical protein [Pleomorphomonas sp. JP5]MCM5557691.1 hypothetical protein [Pleomorphomonas sp. JP5]
MPFSFRPPLAALVAPALLSGILPASAGGMVIVTPPVRVAPAPVVIAPPPYYYAPPPVVVAPYPVAPVVVPVVREPRCRVGGVVYDGPRRTVVAAGRRCW